ncbi:MAG: carbohydrate-binding domain-containing protein [Myxococcales bacterium]|nr:carbohydrate-binding domain-containing protein [Myxococcales bacterium]
MRKLPVLYALFFSLSFFACDNKIANNESTTQDGGTLPDGGASTENTQLPENTAETTTETTPKETSTERPVELGSCAWDLATATVITLNGTSIDATAMGITVEGSKVTISAAGTYNLKGSLSDGQVIVNTEDKGTVKLLLNGVQLTSSQVAAIHVQKAELVELILIEQTQNAVNGGKTTAGGEDDPNAAIYSKADMVICGDGALTVQAALNDGITGKDGLSIFGGTIQVTAVDDGIRGKDFLAIKSANITVQSGGDGLKSDNEEDAGKGYILVESGTFKITSGGDAITAATDLMLKDGDFTLVAGGGSSNQASEDVSKKGIKAVTSIVIDGGTYVVDSADDGLHSNGTLKINGGTITVSSGDDGIHSDGQMDITNGTIDVKKSYEGIESRSALNISGGTIHIVSSDDGLNVAGGNDGSGFLGGPGGPGGASSCATCALNISGGTIVVNAAGDGLDANGSITMTGGTAIVNGPTANNNGAVDYDVSFKMTGGTLIAAGSAGMPQTAGATSTQYALLIGLTASQQAGTIFHIQDSDGNPIVTFAPSKTYQTVAFSSPKLQNGKTYKVYYGGSSTGTPKDGFYDGGVYTPGTLDATFTISSIVTSVNVRSGGRP